MLDKKELMLSRLCIVIANFDDEKKYKSLDNVIKSFNGEIVTHNVFEFHMSEFELESTIPIIRNLITQEEEYIILYHYINENGKNKFEKTIIKK